MEELDGHPVERCPVGHVGRDVLVVIKDRYSRLEQVAKERQFVAFAGTQRFQESSKGDGFNALQRFGTKERMGAAASDGAISTSS